MKPNSSHLTELLTNSIRVNQLSLNDWDLLVRQARAAKLLASVWFVLIDTKQVEEVPKYVRNHLLSARKQVDRIRTAALYELGLIDKVVQDLDAPVIVLKGAAYVQQEYQFSRGRFFSDIDILIPEERIYDAEQLFLDKGWETGKQDPYDQAYYRKWMHELPPMVNPKTANYLDLHHSILPKTSSIKVDARQLILNAEPLDKYENLYTFSKVDMVLHSATHLFHEGELENGMRDLFDLYSLTTEFVTNDNTFWVKLLDRAEQLDLIMPLSYGLTYCQYFFGLSLPQEAVDWLKSHRSYNQTLMDFLFLRALQPDHQSCDDAFTPTARWLLYVRSHYLRMPFYLLAPHLIRKAIKRRFVDETKTDAN